MPSLRPTRHHWLTLLALVASTSMARADLLDYVKKPDEAYS